MLKSGYCTRTRVTLALLQRAIKLSLNAVSDLGQVLLRVLQKMRRTLVCFQRGVVFVLLVEEESPRLGAMAMYQVHLAARFFSGLLLQLSKEFRDLGFLPRFRHPNHRQHYHD